MATGLKTGGRKMGTPNKVTADLKALAGKHGKEAIAAILAIARTADNEQTRLAAWRELLDRGFGKPAQYNEIGTGEGLRLIVETGVPPRAIEPPMVDITPKPDDVVSKPNGINGFDDD